MWARLSGHAASATAGATVIAVFSSRQAAKFREERQVRKSARFVVCEQVGTAGSAQSFVTYNVLCNHLVHDGYKRRCSAADLDNNVRLKRIQKKLAETIRDRALIGLQEVSCDWAGDFHVFFAQHGYHVIFAAYGEAFNGRMGVLLAYPTERFVPEAIRLHQVGPSLPETPSPAPVTPPHLSKHGILSSAGMAEILGLDQNALKLKDRYAPRGETVEVLNPRRDREWGLAARRINIAVLARLRPVDANAGTFCVGVYHMPCLYGSTEHKQAQSIHVLALRAALKDLAQSEKEPCILLGDWNFTPDSTQYSLLCGGGLGSEVAPDTDLYKRIYKDWRMTSAYSAFHGHEPGPRFIDFIWMTDSCKVVGCPPLDPKTKRPSSAEPSDHLMVQAVIEFPLQEKAVQFSDAL